MRPHHILKDFKGTQDGEHDCVEFEEGTIAPLSSGLAAIVVKEGWAKPASPADFLQTVVASVVGLDHPVPDGDPTEALPLGPDARETKVVEPTETKPEKPKKTKK